MADIAFTKSENPLADFDHSQLSLWLKVLGAFCMLFGLSAALPGLYLLFTGGTWYYAVTGIGTVYTGYLIWRGEAKAINIYFILCLIALAWSFYEVMTMATWFWPMIPRFFSWLCMLLLILMASGQFPEVQADPEKQGILRWSTYAIAAIVILTFWGMFQPHGFIQKPFTSAKNQAHNVQTAEQGQEWRNYGRTTMATRFDPQTQITADNVKNLQVAWTYHTKSFADHDDSDQNTPIFANNTVYACTFKNEVHAIDAETGKGKWVFDPKADAPFFKRCRGVTYYETNPASYQAAVCQRRIVMNTIDARLFELDADTGQVCSDFGKNGVVDLREHMGEFEAGLYFTTSAPTVADNTIIVGGLVDDNWSVGEPSGVVRAFDAVTGELRWAWDVGRPGQTGLPPAGETFTKGTPNVWTHPAVDEKLGLVYLPTGNATPDFYGVKRRPFDEANNSSIVALDIKTGNERWKFQTVHHDVWDYDLPSQPSLYDVKDPKTGQMVPALVQPTKRGQLFMLNRLTGLPIAEVTEKPVSIEGGIPEEKALMSRTQPYSALPNIGGEPLTEKHMWGVFPIDQAMCRIQFRKLRYAGNEFTPPSVEPFINFPGSQGGPNWGSGSIDENRGIFIINDLRLPIITHMIPRDKAGKFDKISGPHDLLAPQLGTPYAIERGSIETIFGLMCMQPPYGTMMAVDLNTQKKIWERPVGTTEDLDFIGIHTGISMPIGLPSLGGSVITGSGLIFFASAMDRYIRAFDVENGNEIWKKRMPVGANATPISYTAKNGKQYIVISAGGSTYAVKEARGDNVIAYALPDQK